MFGQKCHFWLPEISGQETSGLGDIRRVEISGQEISGQEEMRTRRDQDKTISGQGDFRTIFRTSVF